MPESKPQADVPRYKDRSCGRCGDKFMPTTAFVKMCDPCRTASSAKPRQRKPKERTNARTKRRALVAPPPTSSNGIGAAADLLRELGYTVRVMNTPKGGALLVQDSSGVTP